MNRDAIVKKLIALRAKANGASTPQEAASFAAKYEELMEKYRLTETDLEIKSSTVNTTIKTPRKEVSMIERVCNQIAALTDTIPVKGPKGEIVFVGLPADLQYADWLFNLIEGSLNRGFDALKMGREYHVLINNGVKNPVIRNNYNVGFLAAIWHALNKMIEERKVAGKSLVVLKHGLIKTFLDENGGTKAAKGKDVKLYDNAQGITELGYIAGKEVKLRKATTTGDKPLLLEGK